LRLADKSPELEKAAELLIGSIDDSGYLRTTLADLATTAQVELPVIEKALALVQTFDPPGIGARDLKECLLLQLERQGRGKGRLAKLVRSHLDEIARNKLPQVAKEMGLGLDELNELLEELRSLNPHPGAAVAPDSPVYVAPELSVERVGNDFKIVQNDDAFPRLRISKLYLRLLEDPNTPEETRAYIKNKLNGGKMLIKSLEQRQSTIRRIAEVIVSEQYDFFDKGIEFLKPLTMQQVADKLGLHETTISRAIANKYMSAPRASSNSNTSSPAATSPRAARRSPRAASRR
jgi:RNA polymerase sigma-54 factor